LRDTERSAQLEIAMNSRVTSRCVLILAAALAGAGLACGCASHADTRPEAQDSRALSAGDERAYRQYLSQQHLPYQDFSLLGGEQQNDYWQWRHRHPDTGGS
jgi:hypothetical protein